MFFWGIHEDKSKPSDTEIVGIIKPSDTEVVDISTFGTYDAGIFATYGGEMSSCSFAAEKEKMVVLLLLIRRQWFHRWKLLKRLIEQKKNKNSEQYKLEQQAQSIYQVKEKVNKIIQISPK